MVRLIPNDHHKFYDITDEHWEIIWKYIHDLNKKYIIPILNEQDFNEITLYQGYSFSSKKTNEIYELLRESLFNGTLEDYERDFNRKLEVDHYFFFPSDKVIEFINFLDYSGGFYIKTHIL